MTNEVLLGIVGLLLSIVGFYTVMWMTRHDRRSDEQERKLAEHAKEIGVMKAENASMLQRMQDILQKIDDHIHSEETFWSENRKMHGSLSERLIRLESNTSHLATAIQAALQHVDDHNREAEGWKQRIVALEKIRI